MTKPTLEDAQKLVRDLPHRDRMLLVPWLVASFDSTGAERRSGYQEPEEVIPVTAPPADRS